jgi:nitrate reductase gamma subunit
MARNRRPYAERLRDREVKNLAPLWRRSLIESKMRKETTRTDMVIVVLFLIALVAILVYFLPGFLFGHHS